jgi:polynucleotide 5'-hydroxyl-kinase GRC3/NOL9
LQHTLLPDRTLLVDGPASVELISGKAEVFGNQLKVAKKVLVREGKRMPFYAPKDAVLNIMLGANAATSEVEGSTIPLSWSKPVKMILELQKRPAVIVVLGESDSGKSSFCTYVLNKLVAEQRKVAIIDGDLGQSDIGPSTSVGYAVATKPVSEIYNLRMQNGYFVGVTSPTSATKKTVKGLSAMMNEVCSREVDCILVNTDGIVRSNEAISYKLSVIKELKPDVVVGVQMHEELNELMSYLGGGGLIIVEPSQAHSVRTPEKRKTLRELTYAKYLKKSKLHCIPISQLIIEPRNGVPKTQEPKRGILVGLYGYGTKFLGIGVLRAINVGRRTLKIQTAVPTKPLRLVFGKVFLNHKLQEVEG